MEGKPVARAGDMHTCPKSGATKDHKGGPILEGCDSFLIEGFPVACLGGRAQCDGPLDTIVTASASVFIEGNPVARMGDSTAHGGVIVGGAGSVFIGGGTTRLSAPAPAPKPHPSYPPHPAQKHPTKQVPPTVPLHHLAADEQAKKERRQARLRLISDGTAKAATIKEPERSKVLKAARDFKQNMEAAEMATLSRDSYHYCDASIKGPPVGYLRASENPKYLPKGITRAMLAPNNSQFRAEVYYPDKEIFGEDAKPIIVYKGTTPTNFQDVVADVEQSRGWKCDYYRQAVELAERFKKATGGNFMLTGHSLGGGEATAAGAVTGAPTVTFNPAGLHPNTIAPYQKTLADGGHINDYIVEGEALNTVQDNSRIVGMAMVGIHPAIAANILANPLPRHAGRPVKVPANVDSQGKPVWRDPFKRHSIDTVIEGIEALKIRNQRELKGVVERR